MKLKYILPVATIASVAAAVAPIATSCSCSTAIKLKFGNGIFGEESGFLAENFSAKANKVYKFTIDFSEADQSTLRGWGDDKLTFGSGIIDEEKTFAPIQEKVTILLNNEDITSKVEYSDEGFPRFRKAYGDEWASTDKISVSIAWPESFEKASIFFAKMR